jgi:lipopolysaccharide transport system ATP-binding protein
MDLFGAAAVPNLSGNGEPANGRFQPSCIYLSRYLAPEELSRFAESEEIRPFFVMRDLRDTLVSLYFSLKVSHEVLDEFMAGARAKLNRLNEEEGLIYLMETQLRNSAKLQKVWLARQPEACVKFEMLTTDPVPGMTHVIQKILDLDVPSEAVMHACEKFAFERLSGGRKKGEEDATSHLRSGAAGGWRKHFTPRVAEGFAEEFGELLVTAGYEPDSAWVGQVIQSEKK